MTGLELSPVWLSLRLATVTTVGLLLIGTPIAWWLARSPSPARPLVEAVTALPLVLPPTVLGFYLLLFLNPESALGNLWAQFTGGGTLVFSFSGLVIASLLYSLPFAVQPLQAAFEAIGPGPLEAAATLGASPLDRFISVASPMALRGYLTAGVLVFAHTLGEFGVVLMVGGNIPGRTRVLSIAIYEHVETINYAAAQTLSLGLLAFSFLALVFVYASNRNGLLARGRPL